MKKILCIGDSLTNGARNEFYRDYPLELSEIFFKKLKKNVICQNESVNGETSSEVLKRAIKLIPSEKFKCILLLAGTNDSKIPIPLKIYERNISQIIRLATFQNLKLFIGLLPNIYSGLPCYSILEGNKNIKNYNKILIKLALRNKIKTCDFRNMSEKFYSDGVHFNYQGYLIMAQKWFELIKNEI